MPRKASSPSRPKQTTKSLALSEAHIRLEALEKEHQKLLKKIKKKRSELSNFVEQMRSVASEIFHRVSPKYRTMSEIDQEIHALFDEIFTTRTFGKKSKKKIENLYFNLQMAGVISPKADEEEDPELDELFETDPEEDEIPPHSRSREYQQAQQELEPSGGRNEESKKVRQIFLRLAEIFHPDKVKDQQTQMRHTEIMKEINKAYQEADLARLLEIEQQYEVGESIDSNNEDEVTRKCKRLEQQNEVLKNQHENLKREMRLVKNTPEGAMLGDYRRAVGQGIDPVGELLEELESQVELVSKIRDFVNDFLKEKISIREFLQGPPILHEEDDDDEYFFEDFDGVIFF